MTVTEKHKIEIAENGFTIVDNIYSEQEINQILLAIDKADNDKETFRKSADLFAIRQFLKEIPSTTNFPPELAVLPESLKRKLGKHY